MDSDKNRYIWITTLSHIFLLIWAVLYITKEKSEISTHLNTIQLHIAITVVFVLALVTVSALAASELNPARMAVILAFGSIALIFVYAALYHDSISMTLIGPGLEDGAPFLNSVYYSIVTWTTLGYGDITPKGPMKIVAASQALVGYGYSGMMIGVAVSLLSQKNPGTTA